MLPDRLDDIVREYVQPDPQPIPGEILHRAVAIALAQAIDLELWDELREQRVCKRRAGSGRGAGRSVDGY